MLQRMTMRPVRVAWVLAMLAARAVAADSPPAVQLSALPLDAGSVEGDF